MNTPLSGRFLAGGMGAASWASSHETGSFVGRSECGTHSAAQLRGNMQAVCRRCSAATRPLPDLGSNRSSVGGMRRWKLWGNRLLHVWSMTLAETKDPIAVLRQKKSPNSLRRYRPTLRDGSLFLR